MKSPAISLKKPLLPNKTVIKDKTVCIAILSTIALIMLAISITTPGWVITALGAGIITVIIFKYPQVGFSLLVPSLFLEADPLSLNLTFGKGRFYHLITVVLFVRLMFDLLTAKKKWRKSILDWPIVAYLAINAFGIFFAPDKIVAIKIMGLLLLLAMLYFAIYHYVDNLKKLKQTTNWFLGSALIVGIVGLYQNVTVAVNNFFDLNMWSGPIMHSDILPFGRPYGTFVEPDWFGTFIMLALVIATVLFLAKINRQKQIQNLLLTVFFLILTILSAVRGAWLGLVGALAGLVYLNAKTTKPLSFKTILPTVLVILVGLIASLFIFPEASRALIDRASSLFSVSTLSGEPRFITMQSGWQIFLKSPIIGFGPGAFKTLGVIPFVTPWQGLIRGLEAFQTNAILTILVDTGLVGLGIVMGGVITFIKQTSRLLKLIKTRGGKNFSPAQKESGVYWLAWLSALLGLMIAYQVTAGLWLGLAWLVLALSVASLNLFYKQLQHRSLQQVFKKQGRA